MIFNCNTVEKVNEIKKEVEDVFKASNTIINEVINNNIFDTAQRPNKNRNFIKFIIIGNTDSILGTEVYVVGKGFSIAEITITSRILRVFPMNILVEWKYEYELSEIVDLRGKNLTLEDLFLDKDIKRIKYTEQFGYASKLKHQFSLII